MARGDGGDLHDRDIAQILILREFSPAHAQPASKWETGYWLWQRAAVDFGAEKLPIDTMYVQAERRAVSRQTGSVERQTAVAVHLDESSSTDVPEAGALLAGVSCRAAKHISRFSERGGS